jgi:RHS repeat-associated protein
MRLGNGKWETAKFSKRLQITELGLGSSATDASLWKVNYEYGELENGSVNDSKNTGNIARQTLTFAGLANPIVQSYKYDALDRITEAVETSGTGTNAPENWKQTWSYDRFGNRLTFTQNVATQNGTQSLAINNITHPSINPNTNRFNENQGYLYDKNGNIKQDTTLDVSGNPMVRQYLFNSENKQTEVKDVNNNNQTIGKYFYDGEGKRVKKVTQNETTVFVYSSGKLVAEYSTQTPQTPSISYMTSDHLGTPRIITDQTGQVKSRRDFMPFGEEIGVNTAQTPNRASIQAYNASDNVRQKFTGYQKDNETKLDFAEARMYQNQHARFTAVDPLLASGKSANPQTFNRYIYVSNNPLTKIDPSGLDPVYLQRKRENGNTDYVFLNDKDKNYEKDRKKREQEGYILSDKGVGYQFYDTVRESMVEMTNTGFKEIVGGNVDVTSELDPIDYEGLLPLSYTDPSPGGPGFPKEEYRALVEIEDKLNQDFLPDYVQGSASYGVEGDVILTRNGQFLGCGVLTTGLSSLTKNKTVALTWGMDAISSQIKNSSGKITSIRDFMSLNSTQTTQKSFYGKPAFGATITGNKILSLGRLSSFDRTSYLEGNSGSVSIARGIGASITFNPSQNFRPSIGLGFGIGGKAASFGNCVKIGNSVTNNQRIW